MNFKDNTTNQNYPKTLIVRKEHGGFVWQLYHVSNEGEAVRISENANRNGFHGVSLEDHMPNETETWPNWRETKGGKEIVEESKNETAN